MTELFGKGLHAYLEGGWKIARLIEDRAAGGTARFDGEGVFVPDGKGLRYRESGFLTLGAARHRAERGYRWHFPNGSRAEVSFDDGRAFHDVVATNGRSEAHHRCDPDDYRVVYDFVAPDAWNQVWEVHGPRKDYTSRSRFTRLHRAGHPVQSPPDTDL